MKRKSDGRYFVLRVDDFPFKDYVKFREDFDYEARAMLEIKSVHVQKIEAKRPDKLKFNKGQQN